VEEIQQSLKTESGGFRDLFKVELRPALVLGIALQFFQQTCGINTAMYYSATILQMAGFEDKATAVWFSVVVALTNAGFTVVALWLIDRLGRRKLLLGSMVGMILGLISLGLSFYIHQYTTRYSGALAVCSLVLYVAWFALGMGPVPWLVNSEIYPTHVRGLANGVATTVNWASNLLVSMTFLSYIQLVTTAGAFWTFAAVGVVAWLFFFFKLPETKEKTIEEIQHSLQGRKNFAKL